MENQFCNSSKQRLSHRTNFRILLNQTKMELQFIYLHKYDRIINTHNFLETSESSTRITTLALVIIKHCAQSQDND